VVHDLKLLQAQLLLREADRIRLQRLRAARPGQVSA